MLPGLDRVVAEAAADAAVVDPVGALDRHEADHGAGPALGADAGRDLPEDHGVGRELGPAPQDLGQVGEPAHDRRAVPGVLDLREDPVVRAVEAVQLLGLDQALPGVPAPAALRKTDPDRTGSGGERTILRLVAKMARSRTFLLLVSFPF